MGSDYPLRIFYDASCLVCALEMDHLRRRDKARRLVLVDMSAPAFDATPFGLTLADFDAVIHGIRPDGSIVRGMAVLRLAYDAVGLGWVLKPSSSAALRPLFDAAYRVFAQHRKPISRVLTPFIDGLRERRARRTLADMGRRTDACAVQRDHGDPATHRARAS